MLRLLAQQCHRHRRLSITERWFCRPNGNVQTAVWSIVSTGVHGRITETKHTIPATPRELARYCHGSDEGLPWQGGPKEVLRWFEKLVGHEATANKIDFSSSSSTQFASANYARGQELLDSLKNIGCVSSCGKCRHSLRWPKLASMDTFAPILQCIEGDS